MPSILFVCTANICRSPMAAALFRRIAADHSGAQNWRVESAGTWARGGDPAAEGVRAVLQSRGIDISYHQSRIVNSEIVQAADLILAMERGQKEALRIEFPEQASRVYLLSEMVGQHFDIEDPIGGPLENYEITALLLENLLIQGFGKIEQLANK